MRYRCKRYDPTGPSRVWIKVKKKLLVTKKNRRGKVTEQYVEELLSQKAPVRLAHTSEEPAESNRSGTKQVNKRREKERLSRPHVRWYSPRCPCLNNVYLGKEQAACLDFRKRESSPACSVCANAVPPLFAVKSKVIHAQLCTALNRCMCGKHGVLRWR